MTSGGESFHQEAAALLAAAVEIHKASRVRNCAITIPALKTEVREPFDHAHVRERKALTLCQQPILERLTSKFNPFQQRSTVQTGRPCKRRSVVRPEKAFERLEIALNVRRPRETKSLAFGNQCSGCFFWKRLAQYKDGLAQAMAGRNHPHAIPEQRGDVVPRNGAAAGCDEKANERLRLAWQRAIATSRIGCGERTEQSERKC